MQKIVIEIIDPKLMRYNTCGDWFTLPNGDWIIQVADTKSTWYNFLIALHELIEMALCIRRGINQDLVTKFDIDSGLEEPGEDESAPYYKEHKTANKIELEMFKELNLENCEDVYECPLI